MAASVVFMITLREKCPYSELFWFVFSRIRSISQYSVPMRENTDQNNSEYRHFLRSVMIMTMFLKEGKFLSENINNQIFTNFVTTTKTLYNKSFAVQARILAPDIGQCRAKNRAMSDENCFAIDTVVWREVFFLKKRVFKLPTS